MPEIKDSDWPEAFGDGPDTYVSAEAIRLCGAGTGIVAVVALLERISERFEDTHGLYDEREWLGDALVLLKRARDAERITCAAIWIDDGVIRAYQPTPTGFVIAGHRHHNCIATAQMFHDVIDEEQLRGKNQGFLTSKGRYVDREEAAKIALAAGQIPEAKKLLFSEDLY